MTRDQVFAIWAPQAAAWSAWVKPITFAQMPESWIRLAQPYESPPLDLSWLPIPTPATAVIVDVMGELSVAIGLALARRGLRPIPLFNAASIGEAESLLSQALPSAATGACLDTCPMMAALWSGASELQALNLPHDAPPAFLLDSRRRLGDRPPAPGLFDNRWICFPTDFPSALRLKDAGIHSALLIADHPTPAADLSHILRRYQDAGITISRAQIQFPGPPEVITVTTPSRFRTAWYSLLATLGLRQNPLGGFGGRIPSESSGTG